MEEIFGGLIGIILLILAVKAGIGLFFMLWIPLATIGLIMLCFDKKRPVTMIVGLLILAIPAILDHYFLHLWYDNLQDAIGEATFKMTVGLAQSWYGVRSGPVQYYTEKILIYPYYYQVYPAAFLFPPIIRLIITPAIWLTLRWWYEPDIDVDQYVKTLDADIVKAGMYQGSLENPPLSLGSQIAVNRLNALAERLRAEANLVREARQYKLERGR
jgi:hypothetical protein